LRRQFVSYLSEHIMMLVLFTSVCFFLVVSTLYIRHRQRKVIDPIVGWLSFPIVTLSVAMSIIDQCATLNLRSSLLTQLAATASGLFAIAIDHSFCCDVLLLAAERIFIGRSEGLQRTRLLPADDWIYYLFMRLGLFILLGIFVCHIVLLLPLH
jgi:hypothetical protein